MGVDEWKMLIKEVAHENDYYVSEGDDCFYVELGQWHSASYQILKNSNDYLQVHQWEQSNQDEEGYFGRAIYSIRSASNAVQFCNILFANPMLRAKRQ